MPAWVSALAARDTAAGLRPRSTYMESSGRSTSNDPDPLSVRMSGVIAASLANLVSKHDGSVARQNRVGRPIDVVSRNLTRRNSTDCAMVSRNAQQARGSPSLGLRADRSLMNQVASTVSRTGDGYGYQAITSALAPFVRLGIEYEGMPISRLSPGTQGVVLLTLYLGLDQWHFRPLVIDQPEANLDPSSVYDSLVPFFRKAVLRRQIVRVNSGHGVLATPRANGAGAVDFSNTWNGRSIHLGLLRRFACGPHWSHGWLSRIWTPDHGLGPTSLVAPW
jgi:hypothetical protein